MKKRLRSPAVLLVAFAMVLVAAGIGYAHWTSTSRIEANVNTGNMEIGWEAWGTNDDGDLTNDPSANDDPTAVMAWNSGNGTSMDPKDSENPAERYDKNVASCWVDGGGDTLNLNIDGAYPSYHCNVYADAFNWGSVPVKATALRVTAEKGMDVCTLHEDPGFSQPDLYPLLRNEGAGEFVDWNDDGFDAGSGDFYVYNDGMGGWFKVVGDAPLYEYCEFVSNSVEPSLVPGHGGHFMWFSDDITLHIEEGILCGWQLDPGYHNEFGEPIGGIDVEGWIHVEQGMEQGMRYEISLEQDWVNWNEFPEDGSWCTFNGAQIPYTPPTP